MSALFGGGGQVGKVAPAYTGLQLQTSSGIVCVPLCWGQARGAPNVIWYGDFSAKAQHAGGKGGGPVSGYDYHASLIMALAQGPIHGLGMVWINSGNAVSLATTHFSLIAYGNTPQAPWSYLVSNHPAESDSYNGIAYVAAVNYDLGSSPYAPATNFEVMGLRWNTAPGGVGDADPALIIQDYLSNYRWSVGIPATVLGNLLSTAAATTTGDNAYQTYCRAMGFGLSPYLQNQEQALGVIDRWTKLTNTAVYWSGYALKFVPFGDVTVTGNGVTYLPNVTPVYSIDYDEIVQSGAEDPIRLERVDPADAYNSIRMEIKDRSHWYDATPVQIQDLGLVQLYGVRQSSSASANEVCVAAMAGTMIQLMLSRSAYIRNKFTFSLGPQFCLLEPMDVLQLTDPVLGTFLCRILSMDESDKGEFKITAEELTSGLSSPGAGFTPQSPSSSPQNQLVVPAPVNTPIIFEPPSTLTGGVAQVWAAVSGGVAGVDDPNWGGANVWISTDGGLSYGTTPVGVIQGASRQGVLTSTFAAYGGANPDVTHTLAVSLAMSDGQLISGSAADAANGVTLSYVGGELISYQTATLTGAFAYNLTTTYRGLYGTSAVSHSAGAQFARLDASIFKYPLPAADIGITLYIKFQSFNIFGLETQDISTCVAYPFTPVGTGYGGGTGGLPTTPAAPAAAGGSGQVGLTWAANPTSDNVTSYQIFRAPGLGAVFGSAALIATVSALTYNDTGLPISTGYTYFLKAVNVIGASSPSAGVSATTGSTGGGAASGTATTDVAMGPNVLGYQHTSGGVAHVTLADNTVGVPNRANVFVKGTYGSGVTATVYFPGQLILGLGLTPGATYWLGAAGAFVTSPTGATQIVGDADAAGNLFFNPGPIQG